MNLRQLNIKHLEQTEFDVLIIGGGINGAVSAAALTARGARVALIDARDFAGFTSQQSSNLVWGGIKYMESYEFGLVSKLCQSRNELLRSFPSTVKEIRFLTTISKSFRYHPLLMVLGSWIYWLMGRGQTRIPKLLSAEQIEEREPLINTRLSRGGIEYSDAYLHDNDARFVFNFVRNAMDKGCIAANYVKSLGAKREDDNRWAVQVEDQTDGRKFDVHAKVMVNAAGAFVDPHNQLSGIRTNYSHQFSKGIHLIVPRISQAKRVLAFFADDGRLFFAIPMANRTCIGTTDTHVTDPYARVTDEDRDFVLSNINAWLNLPNPLSKDDIISERCGVRPLAIRKGEQTESDFLQLSRKHVVEASAEMAHISILGGKLTDCLNVGDEVCQAVSRFGLQLTEVVGKWYGEPTAVERQAYFARAKKLGLDALEAKDTGEFMSQRLWRRYANHANAMLDAIELDPSLSEPLIESAGIRRCEIDYIVENEMIVKLEDFLRRRSKIELLVTTEELKSAKGLQEACEKLFGEDAGTRMDEYFEARFRD
ncbi:MAG: glycerol-3-phosphate dehydrogenase/oxidase [Gammaproteobacteria bacterium]|nr:glycerol-3-phosphate dehydrogenase/oxidase [Gammaproteobacteria bacterium]